VTRRFDRWRGLKDLLVDAVEHGSAAVEGVHRELAKRPFVVLEHVPAIAAPARTVHVVHDASLTAVYGSIRLVNRIVGKAADLAFDLAEDRGDAGPT
jgi:hypothetical protein